MFCILCALFTVNCSLLQYSLDIVPIIGISSISVEFFLRIPAQDRRDIWLILYFGRRKNFYFYIFDNFLSMGFRLSKLES